MDRRSATPEELPPLTLSVLRELDLEAPPLRPRGAHLRGERGRAPRRLRLRDRRRRARAGRLSPLEGGARRAPSRPSRRAELRPRRAQEGEARSRGAHAAPSVHRPAVRRAARPGLRLEPAARARFRLGTRRGRFARGEADRARPLPALRAAPRERARAEHEGASALGDRLWLFHRGNTEQGLNIVAEVPLDDFIAGVQRTAGSTAARR